MALLFSALLWIDQGSIWDGFQALTKHLSDAVFGRSTDAAAIELSEPGGIDQSTCVVNGKIKL